MYAGVAHKGTPPSSHCNNRRSMKMIFPHSSGAQTPNFYTRLIKTIDKVHLLALAPVSVALDPTLTQKTDILQLCRYVLQIEINGYRSLCFRYLDPGSGSSICDPRTVFFLRLRSDISAALQICAPILNHFIQW